MPSSAVRAIQWIVSGACGGNGLTVDGDFGSATLHAVTCFQHQNDLDNDGRVGTMTWETLRGFLSPTCCDPDWNYFSTGLSNQKVFRQWIASGRWYVATGTPADPGVCPYDFLTDGAERSAAAARPASISG